MNYTYFLENEYQAPPKPKEGSVKPTGKVLPGVLDLKPKKVLKPKYEHGKVAAPAKRGDAERTGYPSAEGSPLQGFNGSKKEDLFPGRGDDEISELKINNKYYNARRETIMNLVSDRKSARKEDDQREYEAEQEYLERDPDGDWYASDEYYNYQREKDERIKDKDTWTDVDDKYGEEPSTNPMATDDSWGTPRGKHFNPEGREHIIDYTNKGHFDINEYLREGINPHENVDDEEFEYAFGFSKDDEMIKEGLALLAHDIMSDIEKQSTGEKRTVFRGVPGGLFEGMEPGDIMRDPGFMSTTGDMKVAENFENIHDDSDVGGEIMAITTSGSGYEVHPFHDGMMQNYNEKEFILNANTPLEYLGFEAGAHLFRDPQGLSEARMDQRESSIISRFKDYYFEVLKGKRKSYEKFTSQLNMDD